MGNSNLWKHLLVKHEDRYQKALVKYKWAMSKSLDEQNELGVQKNSPGHQVPDFTPNIFIQYLVCWIVADDQVSVVLPCFH